MRYLITDEATGRTVVYDTATTEVDVLLDLFPEAPADVVEAVHALDRELNAHALGEENAAFLGLSVVVLAEAGSA